MKRCTCTYTHGIGSPPYTRDDDCPTHGDAAYVAPLSTTTPTRDVRLTADELELAARTCRDRIRELERRLKRSTYAGKPNMKEAVLDELSAQRELVATFNHNAEAIRRQQTDAIRARLNMPPRTNA